jgi:hypothetical protein
MVSDLDVEIHELGVSIVEECLLGLPVKEERSTPSKWLNIGANGLWHPLAQLWQKLGLAARPFHKRSHGLTALWVKTNSPDCVAIEVAKQAI